MIDLDASARESKHPEGIPLKYKGFETTLPSELPADVLNPFLSDDLGLVELIADAAKRDDGNKDFTDLIVDTLIEHPRLPIALVNAAKDALRLLLDGEDALEEGRDQKYREFRAQRPSINAYLALTRELMNEYGVGLSDFFELGGSSDSDGGSSKETSPSQDQESTPEASGNDQESTGS